MPTGPRDAPGPCPPVTTLGGIRRGCPPALAAGARGAGKKREVVDDRGGGCEQRERCQQKQQQQQRQLRNAGNAYVKAAKDENFFKHDLSRAARTASRGDTRDPCWLIAALAGFGKDG